MAVYPDAQAPNDTLAKRESQARYRFSRVASPEEAISRVAAAHAAGERILWVVNTVARCQDLADQLRDRLKTDVLCYHGRYRLCDRQTRHTATVGEFQQRERPAVAVTTQVCEMSLDLDADLLVSEDAPITSLIQRFGRANRHLLRDRAEILTYAPPAALPYDRAEVSPAIPFLAELEGRDVSQADLAAGLLKHGPGERRSHAAARFESAGYYATPGKLRDIEENGRTAVLDEDADEVRELIKRRLPIDRYLLSVPRADAIEEDPRLEGLPRYLVLAPSSQYSVDRGFRAVRGARS